jgi:hypothetical protein
LDEETEMKLAQSMSCAGRRATTPQRGRARGGGGVLAEQANMAAPQVIADRVTAVTARPIWARHMGGVADNRRPTMDITFGNAIDFPVDQATFDLEFSAAALAAPAASLLRVVGTASIGAGGRDQYLVLGLNGDSGAGQYIGSSIDFAPGYHGDVVRSINNGLIVGYTGWGLDADIAFDLILSVAPGIARVATGSYSTIHNGGRQYISQIGGAYLNRAAPISSLAWSLPNGGFLRGGKLVVTSAG